MKLFLQFQNVLEELSNLNVHLEQTIKNFAFKYFFK